MLLCESSQVIQYQGQSNLASQLLVRSKWTNNGLGRAHGCTSLAWVTKWLFFKSTKSPSLTRPYLLEDATQDNLPYPKQLTIYSYRMTWDCYIPLPTFPRPIVGYAYRYSIRRRSWLTVIILDLSKPKERLRRSSPEIILVGSAVRQPYYSKSFLANDDTKYSYVSYAVWCGKQAASRLDRTNMAVLIVEGRTH